MKRPKLGKQSISPEGIRLDSWKEIADYLGRDVRTAIRWERDRGLPVHRVPGGRRGAVFAFPSEIDRWRGSGTTGTPTSESRGGLPAPHAPGIRKRWLSTIVGLALAGLGVAAGALTLGAWRREEPLADRIASFEIDGRDAVARTETGAVAWRRTLPARPFLWDWTSVGNSPRHVIVDLDDDGAPEVVATITFSLGPDTQNSGVQDELFCFSSRGEVMWSARLHDTVTFRGGTYGPPWTYGRLAVYRVAGAVRIAWSQTHITWWPSPVVVLGPDGRRVSVFVHSGQIRVLDALDGPDGPLLLAGGVANAHRSAALAVLDGADVTGTAPVPEGSPFECTSCPPGSPLRYFLFPRSEMSRASGLVYNALVRLFVLGDELEATARESAPGAPVAEQVFRFSSDMRLLHAWPSDSWAAHEALEREGRLDHSAAECPMYRQPSLVREWTPTSGWRDVGPAQPGSGTERRSGAADPSGAGQKPPLGMTARANRHSG